VAIPKFLVPVDFNQQEARNLRVQNLASAPSSPVTGQLWYDSDTDVLKWWDGTDWIPASGGTPADATTGSKGVVQLAGDLAGTAASPQIATGAVILTDLNAALKPSGSAAAGDEAVRALGTGAANAFPGNGRLDQLAAPTAAVGLNSQKITSLADGTAAGDAVNRGQLDAAQAGLDAKASVRVATTTAATLASDFEDGDTVDGVTLATGDRILVKDQAAPAANGIYVVAASGAPARATDADAWTEIVSAYVFVEEGTANGDTGWVSTANAGGTLGTTAMPWTQFTGLGQITAGAALTKTGATLDVAVDGSSIEVSGDALRVKAAGITEAMLADDSVDLDDSQGTVTGTLAIGNGGTGQTAAKAARETGLGAAGYYSSATHSSGTSITVAQSTHGLRASRGLIVQVQLESDGSVLYADVAVTSNGDVTVTFAASQGANTIRVTVIG
jgi:hypothetical protein